MDTCPSCGYCKHCGRGGHQVYPLYPIYPWWQVPNWTGHVVPSTGTITVGPNSGSTGVAIGNTTNDLGNITFGN